MEYPEQARLLKDIGCERMQGYWVAAPMPPEDVPGWVARYHLPRSLLSSSPSGNSGVAHARQRRNTGAHAAHPATVVTGFLAEDFS